MFLLSASRSSLEKFLAYDAYAEDDGLPLPWAAATAAATVAQEGCGTWDGRTAMGSWWRICKLRESGQQLRMVMGLLTAPSPADLQW
jgi:hypothetical protein